MKRLSLIDRRTEFLIKKAYKEGFYKGIESEVKGLRSYDQFMYNSRKEYIISNYVIGKNSVNTLIEQARAEALKDLRARILEEFNNITNADNAYQALEWTLDRLNIK